MEREAERQREKDRQRERQQTTTQHRKYIIFSREMDRLMKSLLDATLLSTAIPGGITGMRQQKQKQLPILARLRSLTTLQMFPCSAT